jgi:hypothetical protein
MDKHESTVTEDTMNAHTMTTRREAMDDDTQGHAGYLVGVAAGLTAAYIYDNHIKQVPLFEGLKVGK